MTGGTFMNFDVFEKKAKELGVLGIVVTKDGKEIGKKLWMSSAEEMYILQVKVSLPQLWESQ